MSHQVDLSMAHERAHLVVRLKLRGVNADLNTAHERAQLVEPQRLRGVSVRPIVRDLPVMTRCLKKCEGSNESDTRTGSKRRSMLSTSTLLANVRNSMLLQRFTGLRN